MEKDYLFNQEWTIRFELSSCLVNVTSLDTHMTLQDSLC
jgi:hypothetical protein